MPLPWIHELVEATRSEPCVLVTLRQNKGSSPRESGARMVVSRAGVHGSIGGGNLEYQAIETARQMLSESTMPGLRLEPYGLGPHLNQCCGGSVELLFEAIPSPAPEWVEKLKAAVDAGDQAVLASATMQASPSHHVALPVGRGSELPEVLRQPVRNMLDESAGAGLREVRTSDGAWWLDLIAANRRPLWLFGAGHVGKAVVRMFAELPFEVCWLDERDDVFPDDVPANVTRFEGNDMVDQIRQAPAQTIFVVMTHSHELDEDLCYAILEHNEFAFLGMIGSTSKRRRFEHRLIKRGIPPARLNRLVCPIGVNNIKGKEPATIALSLAAQLMTGNENGCS